jgi:hypothetical protein
VLNSPSAAADAWYLSSEFSPRHVFLSPPAPLK